MKSHRLYNTIYLKCHKIYLCLLLQSALDSFLKARWKVPKDQLCDVVEIRNVEEG